MLDDTAAVPSTAPATPVAEPLSTPEPNIVPGTTKPSTQGNTPRGGYYTAIIFFHGMGDQRRYEEMSNLVADLEKHEVSLLAGTSEKRRMFDIQGGIEPARVEECEDVPFIEMRYRWPPQQPEQRVRFYEAYWAPETAGGVPTYEVITWLFAQVASPWRGLDSMWRTWARYRVAVLYELWDTKRPADYTDDDLAEVVTAFDAFEGAVARREVPNDSFKHFCTYMRRRQWRSLQDREWPEQQEQRCIRLAELWRKHYRSIEWRNASVLITLLVAILTVALLLGAAVIGLIGALPILGASFSPANTLAAALTLALGITGLRAFLQGYLGDVVFWATYHETDVRYEKHRAILERCRQTVEHVLDDERCERVVVIAHSLGTTIAYDLLMQLGRHNRARNVNTNLALDGPIQLSKIDQFLTYGSPIDKIYYFFQNDLNIAHRYYRVREEIRGDMSNVPMAKNDKPYIHWINFWDQADIISGSIQTTWPIVLDRKTKRDLRVDNVQVDNGAFSPAAAHGGYTANSQVISVIYDSIFTRQYVFPSAKTPVRPTSQKQGAPPPPPPQKKEYTFLASQRDQHRVNQYHRWFIALCWLIPFVGPLVIIALARGFHIVLEWLIGAICALPPLIGRIQQDVCQLPPIEPTWTYAVFLAPLIPLVALGALALFWLRSRMAGISIWPSRATSHQK